MYKKMFQYIMPILVILSMISCAGQPAPSMSDDQFVTLYADILIIRELRVAPDIKKARIADVLARNSVTMEDIKAKKAELDQKPEEWVTILQKVRTRIEELNKEVNKPRQTRPVPTK
jgi:hypothetical protein